MQSRDLLGAAIVHEQLQHFVGAGISYATPRLGVAKGTPPREDKRRKPFPTETQGRCVIETRSFQID